MAGRRSEIEGILLKASQQGWRSLFLTVTIQHHTGSRLAELLKGLLESWRSVFSGDRTGERKVLARVKAQIKSVEVRYGRNGWHPHLHVLLLVDEGGLEGTQIDDFEEELSEVIYSRYARKCEALGMSSEREAYHARIVNIAGAAAQYVTKLEASLEVTRGEEKESKAKERSYSMFQLLGLAERGKTSIYGREISSLFQEYAAATKGKRQVSYSREIKELGIEAKEDAELEQEPQEEERVLAVVSAPLWRVICARKLRSALLDVADSGEEERVLEWLDAIRASINIPTYAEMTV